MAGIERSFVMQVFMTAAFSAGLAFISLAAGTGGYKVFQEYTEPPPPRMIQLVDLTMRNGLIGQELQIIGADVIRAKFAAAIRRSGEPPVCYGGGEWPYQKRPPGNVVWMTPSEWTNSDCGEVKIGDELVVTWEYATQQLPVNSIGTTVKVTEEMLKSKGVPNGG